MSNQISTHHCPACGGTIPDGAPQGLCPKCLLAGVGKTVEVTTSDLVSPGSPSLPEVAAAFPQLEILELVGQGGMGCVFKARQPKLERLVALKLLPAKFAADASFRERFSREARVLARLNHPNIVSVYDFGEAGGFFYLLMEFVDGANLRQAMQAGRFTPDQALAIVPKICEALQFAHNEGILHRDIKPENILLDTKGRVKIADFGIAKLVGEPRPVTRLTATGAAIGTPNYMAPEQLEHPEDVDQRVDIYSLGVVFYEMLTGELPIGRFAPPSKKTDIDERVDEIVLQALARERELRQHSAGEVKTQVENVSSRAPSRANGSPASPPPVQPVGQAAKPAALPWSKKAIAAAVLAGIGFFPPLLLLGLAFFLTIPVDHNLTMMNAQAQFLLVTGLSLLPALGGTLLGALALADIRRAAGQLRGRRLAFCATLLWPLLLMNVLVVGAMLFGGRLLAGPRLGGAGVLLMLFPLALLAALGLNYLVSAKVWRWATGADGLPPGQRKSLAPVVVVLGVVLVLALPCLGFALMVWVPMLTKVTVNSAKPTPIEDSAPVREASMEVTAPPRELFTATWTVTSNNVPVLGPVLITETLTPVREPGQFAAQWRVLDASSPEADGVPWEVVLVTGKTNRMVSRPPSGSLPDFAWTAAQTRREMRFGSSREQSFDGEIFRDEPTREGGSATPQTRWSVRLMLRSSPPPRSGPLTRGIRAQFTVPAGQVAVFEVVTLSNSATVPIRNLGAYVIAPAERASEGTFSFTRNAQDNRSGAQRRPWRLEVATAGGAASSGGLDLPTELEFTSGELDMRLGRLPDGEVVRWCGAEVKNLPPNANGLLGLRVRTQAHGLKPGMPGSTGAEGTGTNWFRASAPAPSPGQGISFKATSLPKETLVLTAVMVSNGIPVTGRELRAKLSPLSGRERNRYLVRWQTAAAQPPSATGTIWEVVVEEEETGSIAARLRPTNSPPLVWKVTPYAERITSCSASHEAHVFKVAQALQTAGGGNAGVADWGVRLQLQSAPPQRAASSGIEADFVLPAHQAAVFELVKKSKGVIEPVPNLAAYVVNGTGEPYQGKFLLADDPDDLDSLTALPRWKFGITGPNGRNLAEGQAVPPLPVDWAGHLKLWTTLKPDDVALHGQVDSAGPGPAYGLRIRTHACPTAPGQNLQAVGQGTNWMQAVAAQLAPAAR